eukprot:TRINITY_DN29138_c0_g1_i1.p1 TRINITY_DN29138_c0_g1~~TRINITY_DN29138_c0_g1_i1.p1  ORF type:complete len:378 (+),score=54.19 TRINITY_DN29138_c0_g1_i1:37-1134(+)
MTQDEAMEPEPVAADEGVVFDTSVATCQGHGGGVLAVQWEPKAGSMIASASIDGSAKIWDANSGSCTETLKSSGEHGFVSSVCWAPDGARLATGCQDGLVYIWSLGTEAPTATCKGHTNQVRCVAWCPKGRDAVASGSLDGTVRIWKPSKGKRVATCQGDGGYVYCILWHPDGAVIAAGSTDGNARLFNASTGACIVLCESHAGPVSSLAWGPENAYLATGSHDGSASVWNARTGLKVSSCSSGSRVYAIAWRAKSNRPRLASGSHDGSVCIFDASLGVCMAKCQGHAGAVYCLAWSESAADRSWLASGGQDGTIRMWEASTGQCLAVHVGHAASVMSICLSPGGERLASASEDGVAKIWPVADN